MYSYNNTESNKEKRERVTNIAIAIWVIIANFGVTIYNLSTNCTWVKKGIRVKGHLAKGSASFLSLSVFLSLYSLSLFSYPPISVYIIISYPFPFLSFSLYVYLSLSLYLYIVYSLPLSKSLNLCLSFSLSIYLSFSLYIRSTFLSFFVGKGHTGSTLFLWGIIISWCGPTLLHMANGYVLGSLLDPSNYKKNPYYIVCS